MGWWTDLTTAFDSLQSLVGVKDVKKFAKEPKRGARVMARLRAQKRELKREWRRMSQDPEASAEA